MSLKSSTTSSLYAGTAVQYLVRIYLQYVYVTPSEPVIVSLLYRSELQNDE